MKLAEALYPLVGEAEGLQDALDNYRVVFQETYTKVRYEKLGLTLPTTEPKNAVVNRLYDIMEHTETDFAVLFRTLSGLSTDDLLQKGSVEEHTRVLSNAFYQYETWDASMHQRWSDWLTAYHTALTQDGLSDGERIRNMKQRNPKFVFRNYLAQLAIDDIVAGNTTVLENLHTVLKRPFDEHPEFEQWAGRMPDWARNRAGCSALSCSS